MEYVTITHAVTLTGKSISTIRRVVKRLSDEGRTDSIKKESTTQGERYLIRRDVLFLELGLTIQPEVQVDSQENSQTTIQSDSHEQLVTILREQLNKKDEQIALLLERQRETHVLLNGYQQRLLGDGQVSREVEPGDEKKKDSPWVAWLLITILVTMLGLATYFSWPG